MVRLINEGIYLIDGKEVLTEKEYEEKSRAKALRRVVPLEEAKESTISYKILSAHNTGDKENLKLRFDALI